MERPVTERSNPISNDIDTASPESAIDMLRRIDSEIFHGWGGHPSLREFFGPIRDVGASLAHCIRQNGRVVIAGD